VLAPEGGAVTRLRDLGVRTLGDLQVVPDDLLQAVFGAEGKRWSSLARGEEQMDPRAQITSLSQSIILVSWNGPLVSREEISALIEGLAMRLVTLCPGGGASRTFWELVGRFPQGSRRVRAPGAGDSTLGSWRRLISRLLHLLERRRQGLLGVELRGGPSLASAGSGQISLFPASEAQVRLAVALERINRRCPGSLTTASEHLLFQKGIRWECAS
jgi:nucleotidyltransferase/DNA polymerase involved in DNA repair